MKRAIQVTLALLVLLAAWVGPASAAPARRPAADTNITICDETHFDAAVAAGGAITFACGPATIALTQPAFVTQDFTTVDGGNLITLTGNLTTTLFSAATGSELTLLNIVLDQGYNQFGDGGAIDTLGPLYLDHVRIQNSAADEFGGAIYAGGRLDIRDSTFSGNSAGSGGAIYASGVDEFTIDDSSFFFNYAVAKTLSSLAPKNATVGAFARGGAISLVSGSVLVFSGGSLHHNTAAVEGGALYLDGTSQATFATGAGGGTWLGFNTANVQGGAIYNDGGALTISSADLEFNQTLTTTLGLGGGIFSAGTLSLSNSRLRFNLAKGGGALAVVGVGASAAITRSLLLSNTATIAGGGLYAFASGTPLTVTVADSQFDSNQALTGDGGGLDRVNAHLAISKSSFTNNTAVRGGGLFLQGQPAASDGGFVEVQDTTIGGNHTTGLNPAHSGGIDNVALLDLRNVTIKDNHYGLFTDGSAGATSRLQSSVLDNLDGTDLNCDGTGTPIDSGGHNLSTDNSCSLSALNNDQFNVPAQLGPLTGDPHVFTLFYPPQTGSPLINNGGPVCAASDQRHASRVGACDVGAIEFGGLLARLWLPLVRR